ncbi:MAG: glycosyl transferase [Bacteroidetes bacterium GWE2_42_24]|nr:MAG: glycosyl transferase [Bacteroidetes bacterium GWE2_42_24]OFY32313.1 MAG: glycosyl transferase [Bacteroidetes bacterium GWF2_43_11]
MVILKVIFWFFAFIIFYSYIGYGVLLYILVLIKRLIQPATVVENGDAFEPEVTLFIAAYNEKDYVKAKLENSYKLDYPKGKLKIVWITDGSTDGTPDVIKELCDDRVEVYHVAVRGGKIGAMNRGMKFVNSPIVVFCDANTMLGKESISRIVTMFKDPKVGCVSGEKRVVAVGTEVASASEGIYWKYESKLKKWDAELYSVVGAAGELFAIRRELYEDVEPDTLLDDFMISLRIAMKGFRIKYDPEAYAMEHPSNDVKEELKRKVRISAGGIQSVVRLLPLLNFFRYKLLSFQYISHRVLRWTLAPLGLLIVFISSLVLAIDNGYAERDNIYSVAFGLQVMFYLLVAAGYLCEIKKIRVKLLFIPFYFFIMNYAVFLGLRRYLKGSQSVNWERAKRSK